jgi:hypothetical protein
MMIVRTVGEWTLGLLSGVFALMALDCFESCKVVLIDRTICWTGRATGFPCDTAMLAVLTVLAFIACITTVLVSIESRCWRPE